MAKLINCVRQQVDGEKLAREMEALPPLNTPQEAEMVETVFQNAIQTLSEDDQ
mgnify:CR=1